MGAVTYPNETVVDFVGAALVPLQVRVDSEPLATDFMLRWTPALIVLDKDGKEHSRTIGFVPPDQFIPTLLMGISKVYFDARDFNATIAKLDRIINEYPQSFAAPEAIYYRGVCMFKLDHDPGALKRAYERLTSEHLQSEWVKRALPYRLLPEKTRLHVAA